MDFDSERFEKKLVNLKDTQDSITGLSKWCLNKRLAHKQIVKSWLKTLKEGIIIFCSPGSHFPQLLKFFIFMFSQSRTSFDTFLPC